MLTYPVASARLENGSLNILHTDHLGSLRLITGTTGSETEKRSYQPYGARSI